MSGIAGIYNLNGAPVDQALLKRMTGAIAHRGPDGIHHWVEGSVGLGHCMLETTPESAYERQPLTDDSGNLCLTMDGRVDNREEIVTALESKGFRLRDDTDAEIVLKAYECWGTECPAQIIGDFSFVVWDKRQRQLFCGRDILGVRPFYYYTDGRKFLWGSELHQLFQDANIRREPNEGMVAEYLAASLTDREETLYKGILRLVPAHYLLIRDGRVEKSCYWDVAPNKVIRHKTDEEYAEHFSAIFKQAVRCRLRSNKPVGGELSGGLDSSSVVGMSRLLFRDGHPAGRDFATFSLLFPDLPCDESQYIDAAVQIWGVKSNRLRYEAPSPMAYFEDAGRFQDFPNYPNGMMWDSASATISQMGFRVLLTGCGGDEWLTGSFYHYADYLRGLKLVTLMRQLRADRQFDRSAAIVPAIVFPRGALLRVGFFPLLPSMIRRAVRIALNRRYKPPLWIDSEFARRTKLSDRLQGTHTHKKFPTFAQEDMYRAFTDGWACHGYEMGSRSESRFGLERRHPLSDRRVIEFAFALPEEQRWRERQPKCVLRNAVQGLVPETIRNRLSKADFSGIFAESLKRTAGDNFFRSLTIASAGWIDGRPLGRMYEEMKLASVQSPGGLILHAWTLWMIYGIEAWFRAVYSSFDSPVAGTNATRRSQTV
jgi:asparagine synthase (glutamine-hydrolysing)